MKGKLHTATLRRFAGAKIEPERSQGLRADHEALAAGRTIFPSSVVGTWDSPRFLVSGHNNPKLGRTVMKGPRTGWPIFHVTLEERATCPRSCAQWSTCYGNSMPYARRHAPDADFLAAFKAEVITVARAHPAGLLIRVHALGDFFSLAYVEAWAGLLKILPQLHVFGYTARTEVADDPESQAIAAAIRALTESSWERFAIRFSRVEPGPQHSIVVDADPGLPDVIVCPAQTGATEACATCGLCWAAAAREKTIAFLRHGMKSNKGKARTKAANDDVAPSAPRKRGRPRKVVLTVAPIVSPVADPGTTPAERLAAVDDAERVRIAAAYGAKFERRAG